MWKFSNTLWTSCSRPCPYFCPSSSHQFRQVSQNRNDFHIPFLCTPTKKVNIFSTNFVHMPWTPARRTRRCCSPSSTSSPLDSSLSLFRLKRIKLLQKSKSLKSTRDSAHHLHDQNSQPQCCLQSQWGSASPLWCFGWNNHLRYLFMNEWMGVLKNS